MNYSKQIYTYLFFVAGIILINLVAYLTIGSDIFAVQAEITTNWLVASLLTSLILIPTYVFGLACLLFGGRFAKVDVASVEKSESVWAFFSGLLLAFIPIADFVMPSPVSAYAMNPYVITWLPILITSLIYLTVKKYR